MNRRPSVEVQHWIRTLFVRQHGSQRIYDLHEVGCDYLVPADTEFPSFVTRFDLFLRVVAREAGPVRARVLVYWQSRPGRWELMNAYEHARFRFAFPTDETVFVDQPFHLPQVRLEGVGLYAITVYFRSEEFSEEYDDLSWDADTTPWDPEEPGWVFGAVEYFRVMRRS